MTPTPDGNGYWLLGGGRRHLHVRGRGVLRERGVAPHPPLFPAALLSAPIPGVVSIMNEVPGRRPRTRAACGSPSPATPSRSTRASTSLVDGPPYAVDDRRGRGLRVHQRRTRCYCLSLPKLGLREPGGVRTTGRTQLQWVVARFHPDVSVIQTGYWETQTRLFDGKLPDAGRRRLLGVHQVQPRCRRSRSPTPTAAPSSSSTAPYFADGTPNDLVDVYNQIVEGAGCRSTPTCRSTTCSLGADPGGALPVGHRRDRGAGADGVHITQGAVDDLHRGLGGNQIISNVAGAVGLRRNA